MIAIKALGIEARFDLFHHRTNVTYKGDVSTIHEGLLTDHTVSATRSLTNNTYRIDCGDANTFAAIQEIAWANAYDPVINMLDDCQGKWDGRKRLDTWVIDLSWLRRYAAKSRNQSQSIDCCMSQGEAPGLQV